MLWGKEGVRMHKRNTSISMTPFVIVAIVAIVAITICFLAFTGFNSKITYSTGQEKIEVQATNSNSVR